MVVARQRLAEAQRAVSRRTTWVDSEVSAPLQERIDELDAATRAGDEILGDATDLGLPSEDRIEARLEALRRELDADVKRQRREE